jgi:hypothetical protein
VLLNGLARLDEGDATRPADQVKTRDCAATAILAAALIAIATAIAAVIVPAPAVFSAA